jgi:hypothetical protein
MTGGGPGGGVWSSTSGSNGGGFTVWSDGGGGGGSSSGGGGGIGLWGSGGRCFTLLFATFYATLTLTATQGLCCFDYQQ